MKTKPHSNQLRIGYFIKSIVNLSLIGLGLGVILGTLLTFISPEENTSKSNKLSPFSRKFIARKSNQKKSTITFGEYKQSQEIIPLSKKWKELADEYKDLEVSAYILFEDGRYAQFNAEKSLPSASTIKIAILFLSLEMLDDGKLRWDEEIELTKESIAKGAGWMRYQSLGKKFPIHEITTEMIRVSDNTAANLLIERVGGLDILNKRFKELGLMQTEINSLLPDLSGTNKTSAKDLSKIMKLVDVSGLLSTKSRDIFREVMSTSISNNLLPEGILKGLGVYKGNSDYKLLIEGFRVYNKAGDIGIAYGDAALIEMPNSSRAVTALLVKGPFNDQRSTNLIRDMAAQIISYINSESR